MIDVEKIRKDFPILGRKVNGKPLAYLDSAATSQRPVQVLDAVSEFYKSSNANVARSLHTLAEEATLAYEKAREKTQRFINAKEKEEIIFTKNTTEGLNLVMRGWEKFINEGDKIVTTIMEHHSNFVPWFYLAKSRKAKLEIIDIDENGELKEEELSKIDGAKIVAFSAASNVLGTVNDVKKICGLAKQAGAISVVDAAQYAPSIKSDVQDLGCDFFIFSGHKMLAPFGSAVVYGRREVLEKAEPFLYGSEMIRTVTKEKAEWNGIPHKFEAGTPDVGATIGLGAAIDYLGSVGMGKIRTHEERLTERLLEGMRQIDGVEILGPKDAKKRGPLAAFTVKGAHPHDVAALMNEDGIAIRSGHHCAMTLHQRLGLPGSSRASMYVYTTENEIDRFLEALKKIRKIFG